MSKGERQRANKKGMKRFDDRINLVTGLFINAYADDVRKVCIRCTSLLQYYKQQWQHQHQQQQEQQTSNDKPRHRDQQQNQNLSEYQSR